MSGKESYVKVRKRDLERLTTEVMQLREFLPKVLNGELIELLHKAQAAETIKARSEQEQLRLDCQHLRSRLDAAQIEAQREREEKLVLREQLWESQEQLQQQAEFCTGLGAASCTLLWSVSSKEEAVKDILADSKVGAFLTMAGQTLESFVKSLGEEVKMERQDLSSHETQFVLALAGIITSESHTHRHALMEINTLIDTLTQTLTDTPAEYYIINPPDHSVSAVLCFPSDIAAVTCGRDFLASSARVLLDTLTQLLGVMKPGTCSKLKVLMLMALYNVSISIKGLQYISQSPGLLPLISCLLQDGDGEVCLHALRLLQSLVLEEGGLTAELREHLPLARIHQLSSSRHSALRQAAKDTLEDLSALGATQEAPESRQHPPQEPTSHCRADNPWHIQTT